MQGLIVNLLRRALSWRGALLLLVYAAGFLGFALGATVSQRPEIAHEPLTAKLYYSLGLFVLAGIDLGLPASGPPIARALLWFAFFAAPAVTAGALTEGVLRVLRADVWALRNLRGHVVLAGCGRLSMVYLSRLRARRPDVRVIVVEPRPDAPLLAMATARGAKVIVGDITDDAVLDRLALDQARRVLLLTGDDFANLDAATKILARVPDIASRLVAHVGDLRFAHGIENTRVARSCVVFNSHQVAAAHLVDTVLAPHFERTRECDTLVLGGFGRFGQTVLSELHKREGRALKSVVIIDAHAERSAAEFDEHGRCSGIERAVIDGDLGDPRVWSRALARCASTAPAFVLGSNDDGENFRNALALARAFPSALVVARSFTSSSFAREVGAEHGFVTLTVGELLADSIPDRWIE